MRKYFHRNKLGCISNCRNRIFFRMWFSVALRDFCG